MSNRALIGLALLVVGLGAYIYLVEKDLPSTDERASRDKKVLNLELDSVHEVQLSSETVQLSLVRQDTADHANESAEASPEEGDHSEASWRMSEPFEARADGTEVQNLLQAIASLEKEQTLEDYQPEEVGLEPPRAVLRLGTKEGQLELRVGAELPTGNSMIVGVAGRDQAYRVSSSLYQQLTREVDAWRARDLFTAPREAIQSLNLEKGRSRIRLARRGDEFWLESPIQDRADSERVGRLLTDLTSLRAETFLEQETDGDERGLDLPMHRIEVQLEGQSEPLVATLGWEVGGPHGAEAEGDGQTSPGTMASDGPAPGAGDEPGAGETPARYARVDGQDVTVSGALATHFRPALEWLSREWTTLPVYRIDRLSLEDESGRLELQQAEGQWRQGELDLPYTAVSDVLYAVTDLRAEELRLPSAGGEAPAAGGRALSLVLTGGEDDDAFSESLQIQLPAEAEQRAFATQEGRETGLWITSEDAADLVAKVEALYQATQQAAAGDNAENAAEPGAETEPAGEDEKASGES